MGIFSSLPFGNRHEATINEAVRAAEQHHAGQRPSEAYRETLVTAARAIEQHRKDYNGDTGMDNRQAAAIIHAASAYDTQIAASYAAGVDPYTGESIY